MPKGQPQSVLRRMWEKRREKGHGPIVMTIRGELAEKIRGISAESGIHDVRSWCLEAMEFMIFEHRSGRFRPDPDRHTARHRDDFDAAESMDCYKEA